MMNATEKLIAAWEDVEFVSSSSKTEQFKKFSREFKKAIKAQTVTEFDLIGYSVGHFEVSGFLRSKSQPEKYLYFSTSDVRSPKPQWITDVLIRTAAHEKDYTGGPNQFTSLRNFSEQALKLFG